MIEPYFERVDRHKGVYKNGRIVISMNLEAFKDASGEWGTAVYLSSARNDVQYSTITNGEWDEIASDIRKVIEADGRKCSIE